jgi:tetratricopeptide (TPR) repeat protein
MRWPIFAFFQLGVILGLFMSRPHTRLPKATHSIASTHQSPKSDRATANEAANAFPGDILAQGDRQFRDGRFDAALRDYRSLVDGNIDIPALMRYRIAACLEALGKLDQAAAEFGAVRNAGVDPIYEVAAELGQVRVFTRKGKTAEATDLMCDLILRSDSPEFCSDTFLPECVYRMAELMARKCGGIEAPSPSNYQVASRATAESPRETALEWITAPKPPDRPAPSVRAGIEIVHHDGPVEQMLVSCSLENVRTAEALQQLTAACGRKCLLTPHAQQIASDRTASVVVDSLPLCTVLTAITEPLGIIWNLDDSAVHFCSDREITREALAAHRVRYAHRALVDALARYPGHAQSSYAWLELGNLEYSQGHFEKAAEIYRKLGGASSRSPVAIEASYNLGLALRRQGDDDAAREAFYWVVDASPGHTLAALASVAIGRMYLDQAQFETAIPPLRRAAAIATGTSTVPNAALLLASTYLLMGNAAAAQSALAEHRECLAEPPYRNVAAFISSYARMIAGGSNRQAQREARILTWALVGATRDSTLGPTGILLMGRAYRDLGLGDKMVDLYHNALQKDVPPAIRSEMDFDTSEQLFAAGEVADAIHGFTRLAQTGSGKWNRLAAVRLAEIALDDGRPEHCREWCRKLLEPPDSTHASTALKLMGQAYAREGVHQKAALCFAGHVPEK